MQCSSKAFYPICCLLSLNNESWQYFDAVITCKYKQYGLFYTFISQIWNYILGRYKRLGVNVGYPWSYFSIHITLYIILHLRLCKNFITNTCTNPDWKFDQEFLHCESNLLHLKKKKPLKPNTPHINIFCTDI